MLTSRYRKGDVQLFAQGTDRKWRYLFDSPQNRALDMARQMSILRRCNIYLSYPSGSYRHVLKGGHALARRDTPNRPTRRHTGALSA